MYGHISKNHTPSYRTFWEYHWFQGKSSGKPGPLPTSQPFTAGFAERQPEDQASPGSESWMGGLILPIQPTGVWNMLCRCALACSSAYAYVYGIYIYNID